MKSMCDKILGYIQKHGSITPDECYDAFHVLLLIICPNRIVLRR